MFWLTQTAADVPSETSWLHPNEREKLAELRFEKRRRDWLLGRWTSKQLLHAFLANRGTAPELAAIEVFALGSGAPSVRVSGVEPGISISLSHSHGVGLAVAATGATRIGCDIEQINPAVLGFLRDYLTASEWDLVEARPLELRATTATLLWSAKESAMKALQEGLRRDTRSLVVELETRHAQNGWQGLRVVPVEGGEALGWWRLQGGYVITVVSMPSQARQIEFDVGMRSGPPEHLNA